MIQQFNHEFFDFVRNAPTSYQCVSEMARILDDSGFTKLDEKNDWKLEKNSLYYVSRDNGSIICFSTDENYPAPPIDNTIAFFCAHTDSPSFKLKPLPLFSSASAQMLGVEVYGGPILSTWFDRNLSLAGLINWSDNSGTLHSTLYDRKKPLVYLPSLAIHLDRSQNREINAQSHLPLLFCQHHENDDTFDFNAWLKKELIEDNNPVNEVLSFDLFSYDPEPACYFGANNEFVNSPRLDNLSSCFAGLKAMTSGFPHQKKATFFICSDHEEVGSVSTSGANSSFAMDVFKRIYRDHESRQKIIRNSLLISMDNAHATHPNYSRQSDSYHPIKLNGGVVIKANSKLRYSTNSVTSAQFKLLCQNANIDYQEFVMRSDKPCGSTIGPIVSSSFGLSSVDVGIPTLGMHSIRETTGSKDIYSLYKVISRFITDE